MMRINEIIKEKRLEKGYTQEQMAELLGITAPAVNKWEKGGNHYDLFRRTIHRNGVYRN